MKKKIILEQSSRIDLNKAVKSNCISVYKWIKPDSIRVDRLNDGRDVIAAKNLKDEDILFFNDFSVINYKTKAQAKWECVISDETFIGKAKMKPLTPSDIINKY
jgi:hypothetical protein